MSDTSVLVEADTAPAEEIAEADAHDEQSLADSLIEDVSIDGMCGVY